MPPASPRNVPRGNGHQGQISRHRADPPASQTAHPHPPIGWLPAHG